MVDIGAPSICSLPLSALARRAVMILNDNPRLELDPIVKSARRQFVKSA